MWEEFLDPVDDTTEWSIYITRAARWVCLTVVFVCGLDDKCVEFFYHFLDSSCTIPDEESIFALHDEIARIIYLFSIEDVVETLPTASLEYLSIPIREIGFSDSHIEIGKEVTPG